VLQAKSIIIVVGILGLLVANTAAAQAEVSVGVKKGDWIEYVVAYGDCSRTIQRNMG